MKRYGSNSIYKKLLLDGNSAGRSLLVLAGLRRLGADGRIIFVLAALCPAKLGKKKLFDTVNINMATCSLR